MYGECIFLGDPTVFGNMPPSIEAKNAVMEIVTGDKHNGYAPSIGMYIHLGISHSETETKPPHT